MNQSAFVIRSSGLEKSFVMDSRRLEILRGVDLSVARGEVIGITGASGTGKSTLLHILGGLDRPSAGKVMLGEVDIFSLPDDDLSSARGEKIGFVFQFHHLLPEFSALENVMIPAMIAGKNGTAAKEKAESLFERVGLADRIHHRPGKLSGGEQQRTSIIRALMNDPVLLLADEPTGNLDEHTAEHVFEALRGLALEKDLATVIVTHNLKLAERMDRVYELHEGQLRKKENNRGE